MTTFNTGNPIGSVDPRDLYDNAENLDTAVNTKTDTTWTDRLGVERKTFHGMEVQFDSQQVDFEDRFNVALQGIGYDRIGEYGAGLEINEYNQIFRREDAPGQWEWYAPSPSIELPYTTTGDWATEGGLFVGVGDAALRQELESDLATSIGGLLVGRSIVTVRNISEFSEIGLSNVSSDNLFIVNGKSFFIYDQNITEQMSNGVSVIHVGNGGFRQVYGEIVDRFEVTVGETGNFQSLQSALDHLSNLSSKFNSYPYSVTVRLLSGFYAREEVEIINNDLGWVKITSDDEIVYVDRSKITTSRDDGERPIVVLIPCFIFVNNGKGPQIDVKFEIDDSTGVQCDGIVAYNNSYIKIHPECGISAAGRTNLYIVSNSRCLAANSVFDGKNGFTSYGVYAGFNSLIDFQGGSSIGCRRHNIRSRRGCAINADNAYSSGAVEGYCIYSSQGSVISAEGITIVDSFGDGAIFSGTGSHVIATDASFDNIDGVICRADINSSVSVFNGTGIRINNDGFVAARGSSIVASNFSISGPIGRYGIVVERGSTVIAENAVMRDCIGSAIRVIRNSSIHAQGIDISNCQSTAVFLDEASTADLATAKINNAGVNGLDSRGGSSFNLSNAVLSGAAQRGITMSQGSRGNASGANCSAAGVQGASIFTGSTLNASGLTGTTSQTANTVTASGIIFQ